MPKKAPAAKTPKAPEKGSDRELLDLVHAIGGMLEGRDPVVINRVLDTLKVFYPSQITAKPSGNGVGYMP